MFAAGDSDGDIQMLQYAQGGVGASFQLLVHHDHAAREYAYNHGAEQALDFARRDGWLIVSMQRDRRRILPFQQQ